MRLKSTIFLMGLMASVQVNAQVNAFSNCVAGAAPGCPIPYPYPPQTYATVQGRDNGINTFVGGNMVVMNGGAELEGKNFVMGNFEVQKTSGAFNLGYVGAGSYVIPDNGTDALIVGGNISTAGAKVYFGGYLGAADLPANIRYKGSSSSSGGGFFQAGDIPGGVEGQLIQDAALDLAPYQAERNSWSNTSSTYASMATSGNATFTNNSGEYIFSSTNGATGIYVFNININLDPGYPTTVTFNNFPATAEIVINMQNSGTVSTNLTNFFFTNVVGNTNSLMERLIWNFPNATTVNIKGSSQHRGAILSKAANTYINTSTNGRTMAINNLIFGATGSGLEIHNYPLRAASLVILPVKFNSFTANATQNTVTVNWHSSQESRNSYYILERAASTNGNFTPIATVDAKEASANGNQYSFVDVHPNAGGNFYRLKLVEPDGSFTYSNVVNVNFKKGLGLTVYPNPASSHINVVSQQLKAGENISISIYDAMGKLQFKQNKVANSNAIIIELPAAIANGYYHLEIKHISTSATERQSLYIQKN